MTGTDDRPTVEERYTRAIRSSHLEVDEHRGDVDLLIAAGWIQDGMGPMLYRLACEFDSVAADVRKVQANDVTGRLLILMRMKTLNATKEAFGRFAVVRATRTGFMQADDIVVKLAGQVLLAFLDPNCHKCEGRGSNGGYGAPKIICRACHGSGESRTSIGINDDQRRFSKGLLADMDALLQVVEACMRRYLRATPDGR